MTADPHSARGVSATVKYGKGYEAPWLVFHGTVEAVHEDILLAFGMDADKLHDLSLSEVLSEAVALAQGVQLVANDLGGRVVSLADKREAKGAEKGAEKAEDYGWLIEQLNAATSIDALKEVWARNKPAFADKTVMSAYKAKGATLKGGA